MITIEKGGDIIEYLRSLYDNEYHVLPEGIFNINEDVEKKPHKFHVHRKVTTNDNCMICERACAYNFYDVSEEENYWFCGYCAVNIATSVDFVFSEKTIANKNLGISQHLIRELELLTI